MTKAKALADSYQKINDNYTVTMCENGFVVEVSGVVDEDNWLTTKWVVTSLDELKNLVQDLSWMTKT